MIRSIYFLIILFGCSDTSQNSIEYITAEQLIELQQEGVPIIDVRTKKEYDQGHIKGVFNVDFLSSDFINQMKKWNNNDPIVIHCAVGGRSGKAAKQLQKAGFTKIYDYSGGFKDWQSKGYDTE